MNSADIGQTGVRSAQAWRTAIKARKDADRIQTKGAAWDDLLEAHRLWLKMGCASNKFAARVVLYTLKEHQATLIHSFPLLQAVQIDPSSTQCLTAFGSHLESLATLVPKLEPVAAICFLIKCLCDRPNASAATASSANDFHLALADIEYHLNSQLRRPFQGDAPQRFLRFAMRINNELFKTSTLRALPYFRGTPLVQSRGTGKTRMLLQLGHMAPLLYIRGKVVVFLAAWFETLAADLEKETAVEGKFKYLEQLNEYGNPDIKQGRQTFFKRAFKTAWSKLPNAERLSTHQEIFEAHLKQPFFDLSKHLKQVQHHCRDKVNDPPQTPVPPVFVAVDECVDLPDDALLCLERAWNYILQLELKERNTAHRTGVRAVHDPWQQVAPNIDVV
ncbi:conserved hypothetical Ustilaginaceae-specific protein [Sporisorium reilianum SRZ2]|uniref:Conserved hypothetical Ustilaginaceae-specific protein n=1 Tax=Sporisorium reilianum (strain SRZ2) TaxID=999809 RepID=E6ZWE6_SPORE|nr:conserved hypothetical Ustilaginaceae-specific protein [Sporisorium reilianum SRZ2]